MYVYVYVISGEYEWKNIEYYLAQDTKNLDT